MEKEIVLPEHKDFPGSKRSADNIRISISGGLLHLSFTEIIESASGKRLTGEVVKGTHSIPGHGAHVLGQVVTEEDEKSISANKKKAKDFIEAVTPIIAEFIKE